MSSISKPNVNLSIVAADFAVPNATQRVLLVGQKTGAGSATSGALVTNIGNNGEENALFGINSQLAEMVRAFKQVNQVSRLDAIPLSDNGSGVAAAAAVAFSGTATAPGTIYITVGSSLNHRYEVDVSVGDTATAVGDKLVAAIGLDAKKLVTAVNTTGTVALTAVNKGTIANDYLLMVDGSAAGVTVTLTAFASGATNPTITGIFDVVDGMRYQGVVYPAQYNIATLTTNFLDERWNVNNAILDGVGFITKADTYSNLITLGNAWNTQSLVIIGNKLVNTSVMKGGSLMELDFCISAQFAAVRALRLTPDESISRYVVGGESLDQFGGPGSASLPYFNTPFPYLPIIAPENTFSQIEMDNLGDASISLLGNNIAINTIIAGDIFSTYKTNAGGNPDPSFKYLNYVDSISNAREYIFNNAKNDFRQSRLSQGDLVPNRKVENDITIAATICGYFQILGSENYVLVQAGNAAVAFFKQNLSVTIDMATGTVTLAMQLPLITQLRNINGTVKMAFSIN